MLTNVRLANRLARALGLSSDERVRAHRMFRNFVDKGVIPSTLAVDDERGTREFDDAAGHVAVLLFPLATMATDVRALRQIAMYLLAANYGTPPIDRIVEAVQAGKTVRVVHEMTWHEERGIERGTVIEIDGEAGGELATARRLTLQPLARTVIEASTLLGPMLGDKAD